MPRPEAMDQMRAERAAFWASLAEEMSGADDAERPGDAQEFPLGTDLLDGRVRLKMTLSQDRTSVYLVARSDAAKQWITANIDALCAELKARGAGTDKEIAQGHWFRRDDTRNDVTLRSKWPKMRDWLRDQHNMFHKAVCAVQHKDAD